MNTITHSKYAFDFLAVSTPPIKKALICEEGSRLAKNRILLHFVLLTAKIH